MEQKNYHALTRHELKRVTVYWTDWRHYSCRHDSSSVGYFPHLPNKMHSSMFGWNSEIGSNWSMELPVISSVLHRFTLDVTAPMELITRESCSYTYFHGYWFWCCLLNDEQENHPSTHTEWIEFRRRLNQTFLEHALYQVSKKGRSCFRLHKHASALMNLPWTSSVPVPFRLQAVPWTQTSKQHIKHSLVHCTLLATHPTWQPSHVSQRYVVG